MKRSPFFDAQVWTGAMIASHEILYMPFNRYGDAYIRDLKPLDEISTNPIIGMTVLGMRLRLASDVELLAWSKLVQYQFALQLHNKPNSTPQEKSHVDAAVRSIADPTGEFGCSLLDPHQVLTDAVKEYEKSTTKTRIITRQSLHYLERHYKHGEAFTGLLNARRAVIIEQHRLNVPKTQHTLAWPVARP